MAKYRLTVLTIAALAAAWITVVDAQQPSVLPMGPARERGASITPAFEGWYKNDDGSFSLLIGYYNRNSREPITIPIGPNNKIEPGDLDQGLPASGVWQGYCLEPARHRHTLVRCLRTNFLWPLAI